MALRGPGGAWTDAPGRGYSSGSAAVAVTTSFQIRDGPRQSFISTSTSTERCRARLPALRYFTTKPRKRNA